MLFFYCPKVARNLPCHFIVVGHLFLYNNPRKRWFSCTTTNGFATFSLTTTYFPWKKMWIEYQPNPTGRRVGDCAVRAVAKALGIDWEQAYALLCSNGYAMGDMPSADSVWGATLRQHGFYRQAIPDNCPDCYTAEEFCKDNPKGTFVLGFGGHVATVADGNLFDSWNSSNEIPQFVWYRKD